MGGGGLMVACSSKVDVPVVTKDGGSVCVLDSR